jgi:uncharacterized protein
MPFHASPTRRTFLAASTIGLATLPQATAKISDSASREKLREFKYPDVKLTGGPIKDQYDRIHAHFLSLDNDRLLKVYRQRAGLPAPGEDMGGWYDADGFVPGHTLGQYISGLARFGSATGDAAAHAKVRELVTGYAATLGPDNNPYASPKASTTWPCYILDKYEIGLLDAYQLSGMSEARDLLPRVIRGALPYIPDHTYDRDANSPKQAPYDEPYILPENLFNAWEATGDRTFYDMGRKYLLNEIYFDPLANGINLLPGRHGYSHVIALSSAAKAYLVLGDPKYLNAIRNAWQMLNQTQQYASGGWAPKETFLPPHQGLLAQSLNNTRDHFETPCGCYAQFKLDRYLLRFTGDSIYGDDLERVLYNTILGALDPDNDGNYFYYSDYHGGAKKTYYKKKWPCCSGTLAQAVADYGLNVYFQNSDGIYVNLFTPSQVTWKAKGAPVTLTQTTEYPLIGSTELRVETPEAQEFTIFVRVPGWLGSPAKILVNGKSFDGPVRNQTFAAIRRKWKTNDTVEVSLPLHVRTQAIDDRNPQIVALMKGPLMMVMLNPPTDRIEDLTIPKTLEPVAADRTLFEHESSGKMIRFKPFYAIKNETYSTYFRAL